MTAIKDSPNVHLVVFDLTSVGRPSHHEGPVQYQLSKKGLTKQALATLITKPIHVTPGFDGHFTAGKDPVAIGVFLGGAGIDNDDGSITLRAVGTLWDNDFPDIVKDIQEKQADLGASYEIAYLAASANRIGGSVVEIGEYEFSGGAILLKSMAAHPETALLMANKDETTVFDVMDDEDYARLIAWLRGGTSFTAADKLSYEQRNNLSDSDFGLIQTVNDRKVRRTTSSALSNAPSFILVDTPSKKLVAVGPGQTAITWTPRPWSSNFSASLKWRTNAFAAA